ncbi:hypothetical protein GF312_06440 [Candidatus Poribacteria bacterium]|nr:hypothetical protein [Candidatus Poribacteria bacterium]
MIKYLFCVYFLVLLFPLLCIAQLEEEFIFYYDFNDETIGDPPSEPWKPTGAGEIVVEDFPDASNKSVRVTDNGSGGGMTLILDPMIEEGVVSLEFMWLVQESAGSDVEIFYIMNQQAPDDWSGVCVAMLPGKNPTLEYHDGAWIHCGQIVSGVWHNFKLVMHLDNNKYDFYYDDEEMVAGASFRNYGGNQGVDKFNAANVGNGGTTFETYFDDIVLYEGDEGDKRPMSVEPESSLAKTWGEIKK